MGHIILYLVHGILTLEKLYNYTAFDMVEEGERSQGNEMI